MHMAKILGCFDQFFVPPRVFFYISSPIVECCSA